MEEKTSVCVAMSGGVDSSVAAASLVEQGYDVFGIMLNLWSEPGTEKSNRCCTPDSVSIARRVASILSIPFYVLDARQVFYKKVILPFINDYTHNLTPNPCIYCNRFIRWDFLLQHALSAGAEYLATGHYARIAKIESGGYQLIRGLDSSKDQSYVLHVLKQDQLEHALFPLGGYLKTDVRVLAQRFNLPVAERPDSQDLCFIGSSGDYRHFLIHHAPQVQNPGPVLDVHGQILGKHRGLAFYTIGQRKGLQINSTFPRYVIEKDFTRNALIVGTREESGRTQLVASQMNWIAGYPPSQSFSALVKIRYKSRDLPAKVKILDDSTVFIEFNHPINDITPGQSAVIYNGDICLGGGVISEWQEENIT